MVSLQVFSRLTSFYADDFVLCSKSKEDLKVMVGHFVKVYRRNSLKVNEDRSMVMVLGGEEGLESEFCVDAA